jgi:DNA-binding transcriptional ArsR family regulator
MPANVRDITAATAGRGDADIAPIATMFADASRARVLTALADGRALPASLLAAEAGLTPQGASAHLAKLLSAGLVEVERSGRNRYYRLSGPMVADVIEALARLSPTRPVRSLREGTRAQAMRAARTCYDHLAGRLGAAVTAALVDEGALATTDGDPSTARRPGDPLSAQLPTHPYEPGPNADAVFAALGVDLLALRADTAARRPLLRFCLDWTEQRHHLAGRLGAAVATAWFDAGWLVRARQPQRAVRLTDAGRAALAARLPTASGAPPEDRTETAS